MNWKDTRSSAPYAGHELLFRGPAPLESVSVVRRADAGPRWTASDEEACRALVARRRTRGESLIVNPDGSFPVLDRLASARLAADSQTLELELGPTHYPAHLLSNVENPDWRQLRGPEVMADALAVCALTLTSDKLALWGRRAAKIPEGQNRWHVLPAGHPEAPQSMAEALFTELFEELAVQRHEVEAAHWTGLIRDALTGKPELTAFIQLGISWDELRHREAQDAWESSEILPLPWEAGFVRKFLREQVAQTVPSGHAAAFLAAKECFGD